MNSKQIFLEDLKVFYDLNYKLKKGVTEEEIFSIYIIYLENFIDMPHFQYQIKNKLSPIYYHLGLNMGDSNCVTDNCLWWDMEYFDIDGSTEFIKFMERMGVMSRGELKFTEIICYDNNGDDDKYMEFKVNGIYKKWHLGFDIPNSYIQRFALLCEELTTKGKFTIYDDGGQQFVLDYATEQELLTFNAITMLNRKFLIDANFFEHPID